MRKAGPRITLAPNIYQDHEGISGIARVGKHSKEKSFPHGTALRTINAWLEQERSRLRGLKKKAQQVRGTLAGDVLTYLNSLPKGRAKDNTRWDLAAWVRELGSLPRSKLSVSDLRAVVNGWIEARVPASTINHRRRALAQLWDRLDGEDAPNPVRKIKRAKEVLGEPTAYPMSALTAAIDGMAKDRGHQLKGGSSFRLWNKSRARLRMLLWTGMPPQSLRVLNPRRVAIDLERGELWYPPRGKGAGAEAVLLPLFPEGVVSLQQWLKAGAWGKFSEAMLRLALHRAARSYAAREAAEGRTSAIPVPPRRKKGDPPTKGEGIRVYDLRHSFLTWLYETTGDPYLVKLFGQHANLETTMRYTRKGVPARAREAVAKMRSA
jgi:integrase